MQAGATSYHIMDVLLLCVCSLGLPDSIYPPKSLLVRVGYPCAGVEPPAPTWEVALKLQFLSGLLAASGATHLVFSLQVLSSPDGTKHLLYTLASKLHIA